MSLAAYDALARSYDDFAADFPYERWLGEIEALALAHGLRGRRVLDVACGTGGSFLPLLRRGYDVTGCDASSAMLARAAEKAGGQACLLVADMRDLPPIGEFDLVTCLDDALNYLLTDDDLAAALSGIARCLAPGGLAVWDVNTLAMYRGAFAETRVVETPERFIVWRGMAGHAFAPGGIAEAVIDVFEDGDRARSHHRQRHWPASHVVEVAAAAGMDVLAVHGQHRGAVIDDQLDEDVHPKALFVASGRR